VCARHTGKSGGSHCRSGRRATTIEGASARLTAPRHKYDSKTRHPALQRNIRRQSWLWRFSTVQVHLPERGRSLLVILSACASTARSCAFIHCASRRCRRSRHRRIPRLTGFFGRNESTTRSARMMSYVSPRLHPACTCVFVHNGATPRAISRTTVDSLITSRLSLDVGVLNESVADTASVTMYLGRLGFSSSLRRRLPMYTRSACESSR